MRIAKPVIIFTVLTVLAACGDRPGQRALSGGAIGAGAGAAVGAVTGMGVGTGAVIGGVTGAAVGGLTNKHQIDLDHSWDHND